LLLSFLLEFPVRPRPRSLTLHPAKNAAASLLLLAALILGHAAIDARAQPVGDLREQLAHDENAAAAPSSALGKIVTRLADSPTPPTGRDWAELARETITWGQKFQTEQHPVPPGPVHDALHAATLGEALDPKTADWPQLRSELEALLQTQEQQDPEKPEDQSQQNPDQNKTGDSQNSQGGDQEQNQDGSQDGENGESNSDNSESQNSGEQQTGDSEQSGQNDGQQSQGPQSKSLGDMNEDAPKPEAENEARDRDEDAQQNGAATAPPHKGQTQQVGGAQAQSPSTEANDPALAAALQKLEQIKGSDSPAQLFQLMDDTPRDESANASKKNW